MKKYTYYVITLAGLGALIVGSFLSKVNSSLEFMRALPYILIGVGCGAFGYGIGEIVNRHFLLKHPDIAKQKQIDTNDERNIAHANMAKAKGFQLMTYLFMAVILALALMNVSFYIIITLVAAYLFIEFYTLYYRIKYDREM